MSDEKKKVVCPDPDCLTENDADSETCSKCSLDLASFFALDRVFSVREKVANKAKADADKNKPVRKAGLASLIGGKK